MTTIRASGTVIVHDYLTQRGGAERVVLALSRAFPDAPIVTSVYAPATTHAEFADRDIRSIARTTGPVLRRDHRLGLPLFHAMFRSTRIEADTVVCSSSAFAHVVRTSAPKLVYCHNPARWIYQTDEYLGPDAGMLERRAVAVLARAAQPIDRMAARESDRYVANSAVVRDRIRKWYDRDAPVIHPPPALTPEGSKRAVQGVEPGFLLVVSRLLAYKNVDLVTEAMAQRPDLRLVVVGEGPERERLARERGANVTLLGSVGDDELRWLYANAAALVCPALEDFGLTPLEAAGFQVPVLALRAGGYLETVVDGETGLFFDTLSVDDLLGGIDRVLGNEWDVDALAARAEAFGEGSFIDRIRSEVASMHAELDRR
jgi:glycosyltransferase involved in cell wall biosynthesis